MSEIKVESLDRGDIISIVGAVYGEWGGQQALIPAWKRGIDNATTNSNSGEYDGGDRVIGQGCYAVDGDLLLTGGWGDGAAIRRLNNDGSLTKLWHDNNALYRDTTSTYNHMDSFAFHKGSSQICLTTHNVNGYSMVDYSDIKDTTTTTNNVVNDRPSSQYVFSNGANIDRTGSYYTTGTVTAGDWLYILDYNATHYKKYPRRHWTNGTEELLDGNSGSSDLYTGSAPVDRDGYRGYLAYDEVNDRVYYNVYYNGNFTVIDDASTANPKIIWCDLGDAGVGDDGYEPGLYIPDPANYPNKVVIGGSSRFLYVDITPCLSGGTPTITTNISAEDATNMAWNPNVIQRIGTVRQSITDEWCDKMPGYPWFVPTCSDRGRNMLDGWVDFDNNRIVGLYRHDSTTEDTTTGGRGRSYRSDYCNPIFRMQSANGTKWWVKTGYGYDGHSFKVWSDTYGNKLIGNWSCEFGTYQLDNTSSNIDFVHIATYDHFTTGGHSLSYYVSNNNGSTWESYTLDTVHTFSSSGTQLRVKYVATGGPDKAPYKMSLQKDTVTFGIMYEGLKNSDIPTKIVRRKIRGRKF